LRNGAGQVRLLREKLELSPVYSTAMVHDGHKLGYIRLVNFSQHAATDMEKAVTQLEVRTCPFIFPFCYFFLVNAFGDSASYVCCARI
jgi:hypothetical protein